MPRSKKKIGIGAIVECFARFLHPSDQIRRRFVNMKSSLRLKNLVVVGKEVKKVNKKMVDCIVVHSEEVKDNDNYICLHAAIKHFTVTTEGPAEEIFGEEAIAEPINVVPEEETNILPSEVAAILQRNNFDEHDMTVLENNIQIDDDNAPAPENIPDDNEQPNECTYNEWGHDGICFRRLTGSVNNQPKINIPSSMVPSLLDLFELLFPKKFIIEVMLKEMNSVPETEPITYGEFLRWLGLWFLMATIDGPARIDYWRVDKKRSDSRFDRAPYRLNDIMSRNRFDTILRRLCLTNMQQPTYRDRFWEVRQLIQAWNENMSHNFSPGWISCLDESMSVWTNMFTCPGFMFVPRKPHPYGNEWHSICCGLSGLMFAVELVEGRDRPIERPQEKYDECGKTGGLLIRLTEKLWGTGSVVVLDSGFCVLKALIELRNKGVFAAAVVKKRRYWPKHVDGEGIKAHFDNKQIGEVDAIRGTINNTPFYIMGMKEAPYVMTMMTTYGTLERTGKETERRPKNQDLVRFNYPEVFGNHFKYRHMVDDHNSRRHSPNSFEETWATKTWSHRVFSFLIAVSEVNCQLAAKHFYNHEGTSQFEFRLDLANELIYNKYLNDPNYPCEGNRRGKRKRASNNPHEFMTLPPFKKFRNKVLVRANMKYGQYKCVLCKSRTRKYCRCSPGIFYCQECYAEHKTS
jgi:Transposase IS4